MTDIKALVLALLADTRGDAEDNLYRARRGFAYCTPEQMQEEYGLGGRTRAAILASYESRKAKVNEAIAWVEAQPD